MSRSFSFGKERVRLIVLGEVFNLFNTANLVDYGGNIANTETFGQAARRFDQVFGSGGPRAFQLGARVNFRDGAKVASFPPLRSLPDGYVINRQ